MCMARAWFPRSAYPAGFAERFRELYSDDELTEQDADAWIAMWEFATERPEAFERAIKSTQPTFGIGDWFAQVRAYLHVPPSPSDIDREIVAGLTRKYRCRRHPRSIRTTGCSRNLIPCASSLRRDRSICDSGATITIARCSTAGRRSRLSAAVLDTLAFRGGDPARQALRCPDPVR